MKKLILLLTGILISSCSDKAIFSEFDQVEHYKLSIENSKIDDKKDNITSDITYVNYPKKLDDSLFYKELNKTIYKKSNLSKDDVVSLNNYLIESSSLIKSSYACIPIYRDILILKKEGKIIGIAKICFECEKLYFMGNKKKINSEDFDNYKKLKVLLNKYK